MEDLLADMKECQHENAWLDYKTEARIYTLSLFNDEYMDDLLHEILLQSDSSISDAVTNVARIIWTSQDVRGKRARDYKHRTKFDRVFMNILGFRDRKTFVQAPEYYRILQRLVTMKW